MQKTRNSLKFARSRLPAVRRRMQSALDRRKNGESAIFWMNIRTRDRYTFMSVSDAGQAPSRFRRGRVGENIF